MFPEFLIFIQKQQKDFEGAFTQSKALDKRQKGDGTRLMDLARLCVSNENYIVAEKCYQYVISKGKDNPYYDMANIEKLNANYLQITNQPNANSTEVIELNKNIESAIKEYGISNLTLPFIKKSEILLDKLLKSVR